MTGELISIGVAFSWTATALLSEYGSKRMGNLTLNVLRMGFALVFSAVMFWMMTGSPLPASASSEAYGWMLLSGFTLGQSLQPTAILAMAVTLLGIGITILGRGDGHHRLSLKLPLNGVFFAVGAAVCQGVGLVLSKIGMDHYEASMTAPVAPWLLPFFANFFRCIAGIVGFAVMMHFKETFAPLRRSVHDRKGMTAAVATTIFGPFVGVGCSLMAVQYTAAGIASTLMALTPIIIILPARWLFGQPITLKSVVGAIISVVGVSLFFLL